MQRAHVCALHGGVGLVMAKIRELYWIPRLLCWGCKKFRAVPAPTPPAKWLQSVRKDEELNDLLRDYKISWRFNLSRAPGCGGQFERLIGLMKAAFYKTVGGGMLTWGKLSEVLLDVEIAINNRPLSYMEEDVILPTLTPNSMLFLNQNYLPELKPHQEDNNMRKQAKFLRRTKEEMWRRWTNEYIQALRERHRLKHESKDHHHITAGDAVLIESTERNRNHWPLGIVENLITGKDRVIRAVRLRSGRDRLERAVQQIYPLELSCDIFKNVDGENTSSSESEAISNPLSNSFQNVKLQSKQRNGYVNY